jgi:3-hydroxybutyryl-CoA dehydrogenase
MGKGIAQAIIKSGLEVTLYDLDQTLMEKASSEIKANPRHCKDPDRLKISSSLAAAVGNADLVIEAIYEDLSAKCSLFAAMNKLVPAHTILASNTSSLSISAMAHAAGRPRQVVGLHFFNPALIMRLVEVILPSAVGQDTITAVMEFLSVIKKTGIKCQESPGFVVNRLLIPVINEAFYLLQEQAGDDESALLAYANDMDTAIVHGNILLMGPFDLADLTGIDTIAQVAKTIYAGFRQNPRFLPPPLYQQLITQGRTGRKSGRGIYYYRNTQNDPDLNPCLDAAGKPLVRAPNPMFRVTDLVAVMVNEAYTILEEGIVDSLYDIETAMELGTRWPRGPFRLAKELGCQSLYTVLHSRYETSGQNPRYKPSQLFEFPTGEMQSFFAKS